MNVAFPETTPKKIASGLSSRKVHITVYTTSASLYLGHSQADLTKGFSGQSGIQVTQAGGTVELQWSGDLWAAPSAVDVEAFIVVEPHHQSFRQVQMPGAAAAGGAGGAGGGGSSSPSSGNTGAGGTSGDRTKLSL